MTNKTDKQIPSNNEIVSLHLNTYSKIEQAELITRLTINSNLNKKETMIAMCCISDLLHQTMIESL